MTSRERVLTAFLHKEPDCVPCWCGASVGFWNKAKRKTGLDDEALRLLVRDDFRKVSSAYVGPLSSTTEGSGGASLFGIQRSGIGYGQPLNHPLADAALRDLEKYAWPNPDWIDVTCIRDAALRYQGRYAVLGGEWSPFWHDAIDLVGMEGLLYRMYDEPEFVDTLLAHIVDFYVEVNRRTFDAAGGAIDIFFMGNDFGSQMGPLIGENMFRRFLLPSMRRLTNLGHDYSLKVMLHCCGGVAPLIPAMIEAGIDGLQAIQPSCAGMDLAILKSEFGKKLVFNGCIDSQHILIGGTPSLIRQNVQAVIGIMKPGGGFVASASHNSILEETPVENVLAMFDAIHEYGKYW